MPSDAAAANASAGQTAGQGTLGTGGAAGRYALALLDLARDKKAVDAVATDVETLGRLYSEDAGFRAFVADPRLDAGAQKRGAFAVLDRAGIGGDVKNLVGVLITNRRLGILPQLVSAFGSLLAEQRGQQTAEVTTAHPLSGTQRAQIAARLTEAGYSNARLIEHVDASILGGIVIRIGSRLYDTSIKSRLQRLSYAMKGAA